MVVSRLRSAGFAVIVLASLISWRVFQGSDLASTSAFSIAEIATAEEVVAESTTTSPPDRWAELFSGQRHRPPQWSQNPIVLQYVAELARTSSTNQRTGISTFGNWEKSDSLMMCIQEVFTTYFYNMPLSEFRASRPNVKHIKTLSIGCGDGAWEKSLVVAGFTDDLTGFDTSHGSVARANSNLQNWSTMLRFAVFDANSDPINGTFDLIYCHHSLHHIQNLEFFYEQVYQSLRPGGIFAFEDFVGPTRYQWTPAQLQIQNKILQALPRYLRNHALAPGVYADKMHMHTHTGMIREDPSEAVRSSEILPVLEKWFSSKLPIVERVPLGGTILHPLFNIIGWNFNLSNPEHASLVQMSCIIDWLALTVLKQSDFVAVVTRKA